MFIPKYFLASIMESLADYEISKISDEFKKGGHQETLLLMSKEYSLPVILNSLIHGCTYQTCSTLGN